jgi:hypothetical protein
MSQVTGDRFSDENRQPLGDHKLNVNKVIEEADPAIPPMATCVNHELRYGDRRARSVPYVVTAKVRSNESPIIRGRSTRIGGKDNRKALMTGAR